MRENNKKLIIIIGAILLVGITVVWVTLAGSNSSEEIVTNPTVAEKVSMENTEIPATQTEQTVDAALDEDTEVSVIPTVRAGLESTDPSTVNLNSGDIQLVEAFAFW